MLRLYKLQLFLSSNTLLKTQSSGSETLVVTCRSHAPIFSGRYNGFSSTKTIPSGAEVVSPFSLKKKGSCCWGVIAVEQSKKILQPPTELGRKKKKVSRVYMNLEAGWAKLWRSRKIRNGQGISRNLALLGYKPWDKKRTGYGQGHSMVILKLEIALWSAWDNEGGYRVQCHACLCPHCLEIVCCFLPSIEGCSMFRDCYISHWYWDK